MRVHGTVRCTHRQETGGSEPKAELQRFCENSGAPARRTRVSSRLDRLLSLESDFPCGNGSRVDRIARTWPLIKGPRSRNAR